jgi:phosphate transport system substrate-binding protein
VLAVTRRSGRWAALALGLGLALAACGDDGGETNNPGGGDTQLSGTLNGDGSSTVFPIMEAAAEEFGKENPDVRLNVGESGTGGGFEKFCNGETDFSNASRAIEEEEKTACASKNIAYTELQIGSDGLSVVTNKDVAVDCLTTAELKKLFGAGSTVKKFSDIKAGLPGTNVALFTPGSDSGTYDFFQEEILGEDGKYRTDGVQTSEDDNVLVRGITGSPGGVGFFGFAYYEQNKDNLNLVGVDGGNGCVKPSVETVRDNSYTPLSRPLFVYVKNDRLKDPAMKAFLQFLLGETGRSLITEVGYVDLPAADYEQALSKIA